MNATPKKILIVDDDADFAEALSVGLRANGYTVLRARDGKEGLKLAKIERPDLIIMDIMMDERTEGFFTIQEIRRVPELRDLPVFVISALYSEMTDFRIAPDDDWLAHDEFLSKPVDMTVLLEKVRRHIGAPAPAAETASKEAEK